MHCPFCNAVETKVVDSRLVGEGAQVRRRRECLDCHERFTTFETSEIFMPIIIKRDGRREAFNLENLRAGMMRALEKRPVSVDDIDNSIDIIVQQIKKTSDREIDSRYIGDLVMAELYKLDHVAYVRFASVYKRFEDVSDFHTTIEKMRDEHPK